MLRGDTRLPRPGTVIALLALVLAVAGGSAYAGSQLAKNSVKAKHIAKNAVTNKHTQSLTVGPVKNVKAFDGIQAFAPKITLLRRGPFRLYGQCYAPGPGAVARVFITSAVAGAVGSVSGALIDGAPSYFPKDSALQLFAVTASEDSANSATGTATAVRGRTALNASVSGWIKGGTLTAGDGTYGAGKRCIFQATETGSG